MPAEKRNKFLDVDESDDDESQGYNSEAEELQKGRRTAKRRKISDDASSDEDEDEDYASAGEESDHGDTNNKKQDNSQRDTSDAKANRDKSSKSKIDALPELPDVSRPLTKKNLVATEAAIKKSGLVYLSRVPPFMKPAKLRSLLEPYGKINRIFLTPEDPQERARRIRQGGNKKHMYTDGWVEFVRKEDAKKAVDLLNARTIGGKKNTYYRDDIWSLLYLKGFKWHNLTEQINSEMAERTSRMRAEISKSTKENKEFVRNVERAKMLEGIQTKAAAKRSREGKGDGASAGSAAATTESLEDKRMRKFKQASVAKKGVDKAPEEAKRVLSKLF
ncbi:Pre-rRNA-processing protein [Phytophthora cactorum]|nr:Pre-rRNA-processing protein [Phytophthora cactorum]